MDLQTTATAVPATKKRSQVNLPMVTVITPAYNEERIISTNLKVLCDYLRGLEDKYRWEILVVNDGSKDDTGRLAESFAADHPGVRIVHHKVNRNLGGAIRTGFNEARGDYVVVLDLDLSYAPDHIERLLAECESSEADIVIASPYMKGGKCTKVPFFRLLLSKTVNWFMRLIAPANIYTFTGMVRAYRREFLDSLNLKSSTYAINPEILHKGIILRARMVEIPAHLDWSLQEEAVGRTSSIRIFKGILSGLMSSFIFRPYAFFMITGLILLIVATWTIGWIFIHTAEAYPLVEVVSGKINDRFSEAVAEVFRDRPHAFFVGGFTLVIALQFLSLGFLSLQSKRYFDELFHLGTSILKRDRQN